MRAYQLLFFELSSFEQALLYMASQHLSAHKPK